MPMENIPSHTPFLYSKTGGYRGIPIFLIFVPKHRLWVLVRIPSARRFLCVPTINILSKHVKTIINFPLKFSIFNAEKILCVLHGHVFVMNTKCFGQGWGYISRDTGKSALIVFDSTKINSLRRYKDTLKILKMNYYRIMKD